MYAGTFEPVAFGKGLSALRRSKGERQEELAQLLSTTRDIVSKWERGVICPDLADMKVLAAHYEVPLSKLYFGLGEGKTETPVQMRRRRAFSFAWLGGAIVLAAAAVSCAVILPGALEKYAVYTVEAGGVTYQVSEHDWFTPAAGEREGYDFVGYEDRAGERVTFPVKISSDTVFTAVFTPHEYTIDYWLGGGSFRSTPTYRFTVESGAIMLPRPVKSGAQFEGWYENADYSGSALTALQCAGENVALYARWSDESYSVRYELGGGTLREENPTVVTRGQEVVLHSPVREGYLFLGWYDSPTGGTRYTSVGGEHARNVALYALWQESGARYSVLYDVGGGTPQGDNPVSVGAGEVHELFPATKTGYDFLGWNESRAGTGKWYDVLYGIEGDLTLYAVWRPKEYSVVYLLDGGTYFEGENPNRIAYGTRVELCPVVKQGHTFLGWYDAPTGGNLVEFIDTSNIFRITALYARFSVNNYTIVLDGGGGTFSHEGREVEQATLVLPFGQEYALPDCLRAGYDFIGWFDEEGKQHARINRLNIGNFTLTARYLSAEQVYNVEYELNGGTLNAENPARVGYGQEITLHEPERYGYRFLGWNDRADASGTYYNRTPAGGQSDLKLYAIWQEIRVSGTADNFTYSKGHTSAIITGYAGVIEENSDLVIPAVAGGVPVVEIRGALYEPTDTFNLKLRSLTIPDNITRIGASVFQYLSFQEPVVIPRSVLELGIEAFKCANLSLYFDAENCMEEIGERAFSKASFKNVVSLPKTVKILREGAFDDASLMGIVLPEGVEELSSCSLNYMYSSSLQMLVLYLPASLKRVAPDALPQRADLRLVTPPASVLGITLSDEGKTQFLAGRAFALPTPTRAGMHFVGWYDEVRGEYAAPYYVPDREGVTLTAKWKPVSASDGTSYTTPAQLAPGNTYEIVLAPKERYFFLPAQTSCRLRIKWSTTPHDGSCDAYYTGAGISQWDADENGLRPNVETPFAYKQGYVMCADTKTAYYVTVRITIELIV